MPYKNIEDARANKKIYNNRTDIKAKHKEYNARPEVKARKRVYHKTDAGKKSKIGCSERYRLNNGEKIKAQSKAKAGYPQSENCEVKGCKEIGHRHHEDYNRAFEVNWLCATHHGVYHNDNELPLKEFIKKGV